MDNLRGAILMIVSMLGFAGSDAFIKLASATLPLGQVVLVLGTGGSLVFAAVSRARGRPVLARTVLHPAVLWRNAGELVGTVCFMMALALIPLSLLSAIIQAAPLFVTLGAIVVHRAEVGWRRWSAIVIGLAGVLMIIRPGFEGFDPYSVLALGAALALAVRDLATRSVPAEVHSTQLASWGFAMLIPFGLAMVWLAGGPAPVGPREAGLLLGMLTMAIGGYYAITVAMRMGDIAVITPYRYTRLVFALVIAWAVFGERPDGWMLTGAAIVVGSGLYTLWRERRIARRARPRL